MAINSIIRKCTCECKYQDARYGYQQRVFNKGLKTWNCAVCGFQIRRDDAETKKVGSK